MGQSSDDASAMEDEAVPLSKRVASHKRLAKDAPKSYLDKNVDDDDESDHNIEEKADGGDDDDDFEEVDDVKKAKKKQNGKAKKSTKKPATKKKKAATPAKKPTVPKKSTVKREAAPMKDVKPKKVYDLPGQKFNTPEELDVLRLFYESLYKEQFNMDRESDPKQELTMGEKWCMERGIIEKDAAIRLFGKLNAQKDLNSKARKRAASTEPTGRKKAK